MSDIQAPSVTFRFWHMMVLLIVQLLGLGLGFGVTYGRLTQQIEDLNQRIIRIEDDKLIGRDEFNAWREEMQGNLARIESEILNRNLGGIVDGR